MKLVTILKKHKGLIKVLLFILFIGAISYFFGKTLVRNYDKVSKYNYSITFEIVLSGVLLILPVFLSGILWGRILFQLTGRKITAFWSSYVHTIAWLSKYIPGQMGLVLSKLAFAHSKGFDKRIVFLSSFYENVFLVLSSLLISMPFVSVFLLDGKHDFYFYSSLCLILFLCLFLYKPFLLKFSNLGLKLIKIEPLSESNVLSTKDLALNLILYIIPRILNAVAFILIAESLFHVESNLYIILGATYVFSSIIGMLAIFAPGGLGVREAIVVLILLHYIGVEKSVVLAIVSRFIITITDIILLAYVLVIKFSKISEK